MLPPLLTLIKTCFMMFLPPSPTGKKGFNNKFSD